MLLRSPRPAHCLATETAEIPSSCRTRGHSLRSWRHRSESRRRLFRRRDAPLVSPPIEAPHLSPLQSTQPPPPHPCADTWILPSPPKRASSRARCAERRWIRRRSACGPEEKMRARVRKLDNARLRVLGSNEATGRTRPS
eukprot:scaffold40300_cov270-Isochrysis_galbana.AAC.9